MYKKLIIAYCYELLKWITLAFIVYNIVLAVHSNQLTKRIENLENNLKIAARRYIKNHADDDSEILTSDELIENKYLTSSKLKTSNDTCEGYVMITDDYEVFIHCNNYETEGY